MELSMVNTKKLSVNSVSGYSVDAYSIAAVSDLVRFTGLYTIFRSWRYTFTVITLTQQISVKKFMTNKNCNEINTSSMNYIITISFLLDHMMPSIELIVQI